MSLRSSIGGLRCSGGLIGSRPAQKSGPAALKFRHRRNEGGFTLLEFIAVLALIGFDLRAAHRRQRFLSPQHGEG